MTAQEATASSAGLRVLLEVGVLQVRARPSRGDVGNTWFWDRCSRSLGRTSAVLELTAMNKVSGDVKW